VIGKVRTDANDKPIRYYKNLRNFNVPSDSAQVILSNCTNGKLLGLNLSDIDVGIQLGFSSQNIIMKHNLTYNNWLVSYCLIHQII
jgi:hypothetical protein